MYEIYMIDENVYQIHSSFQGELAMEGTLLAILTYAVHKLGFTASELEVALVDMNEKDNNACHFGINRHFIFSFDRNTKKTRKTG